MRTTLTRTLLAAAAGAALLAAPAHAADPGRWVPTGRSTMPLNYYQGVTHDPKGNFYFDGVFTGLYRTDSALNEQARNENVIDPMAAVSPGFNHIGDLTWDAAEGGRLILPLECYTAGAPNGGNTCGVGGFGVADPKTLAWRYWVKLDPADIPKAMWAEVSPDGKLIWTSSGRDLLAYSTADVTAANAQPSGPLLKPVRRLAGAVPEHGITGATFIGGRLFVANQDGATFQVISIDLASGANQVEVEKTINGESEGLDLLPALGGSLHWQVMPISETGPPTYEKDKGSLLHFLPKAQAKVVLGVTPRKAKAGRRTKYSFTVKNGAGGAVQGARVTFGAKRATSDAHGRARLTLALAKP
ncbi:MAG: hypothetical protein QOJ07_177, partial [Thermoleophilaceae bacterium]|nr:hypothetical protein [Thermoleophilaceae bacterium]